jgi:hypothetical protein
MDNITVKLALHWGLGGGALVLGFLWGLYQFVLTKP